MRNLRAVLLIVPFFLVACSGILPQTGKSSPPVKRFVLEYAPPAPAGTDSAPLDAVLKVERFSAVGMLNSRNLYYRSGDYRFDVYNYYLWIDNPADMVADFLARDLREAGGFRAVFTSRSPEQGRFRLEGGLLRFFEDDEQGSAVIELSLTLFDSDSAELDRRIIFQRNYTASKPSGRSAEAMAAALSAAARELSGLLIRDIRAEAGQRIMEDKRGGKK